LGALFLLCALAAGSPVSIDAPHPDSHPRSAYLAIEGSGPPGRLEIRENGTLIRSADTEADGEFDFVLKPRAGEHLLTIASRAATTTLRVTMGDGFAPQQAEAPWERLQIGDVIFSHASDSQQVGLYDPKFTHAALYIGPDPDGTPMVLEATAERGDVQDGRVALVTLEESLPWTAEKVSIYRVRGGLRPGEKRAISGWARSTVARDIPFWTVAEDFGSLFRAWLMWDRDRDCPRDPAEFNRLLATLRARVNSTDRFNCATVIWRAFLDATQGRVDLSQPNRASIAWVTPRFMETIRPVLLIPDTLALSGKLAEIAQ